MDNAQMIANVNSPYIHEATSENFTSLVLENSGKGPVLVNFWSRKAGPCLRQYPILDKLIHHYAGRLLLINVDTEKEIVVSKQYGVTSVPTLKLFRHSQVMETLHGYQSEDDLLRLLDLYVTRDSDLELARALQLYSSGNQAQAYEVITDAIVEDPVNPRLPLTMAKLVMHEKRYPDAIKLLASLPDAIKNNREIQQLTQLLEFYNEEEMATELFALEKHAEQNPDDLMNIKKIVAHYVLAREFEKALALLLQIMDADPDFKEQYPRHAMLKIFNILGDEHPLISEYRPHLQRYSY